MLRDFRLKRQHCFLIRGLVGFHSHGFNLCPGTVADVECGGDLAFISRRHFFLLGLRSGATTGGVNRLKMHWRRAGVLVLEMADRLFIGRSGVQVDRGLLPFQFGARGQGHDHRQGESEEWCFHFWSRSA